MERTEALERFESYVSAQTEQMWKTFQAERESRREQLIEKLTANIRFFLREEEQKRETEHSIRMGYLTISYLQSGVVDGSYTWYLELQDKSGALDQTERVFEVSMKEFFIDLEELEQSLKKEAKRYVGKIQEADCEAVKLKEFRTLKTYLAFAGVKAYQKIRNSQEIKELSKETIFRVTLGEYKGSCQLIGLEDNQENIQKELEEKLFSDMEKKALNQSALTRRSFCRERWKEKQVLYRNLLFSDFHEWQAYHVEFAFCNLMGVNFSEASIQDCSMIGCVLHDASFECAVLNGVLFFKTQFSPMILPKIAERKETEEEMEVKKGILPASFRGAVLKRVNFTGAILDGCDFRGANMEEVIFEEASMQGTLLNKEEIDKLDLSKEQKAHIRVFESLFDTQNKKMRENK